MTIVECRRNSHQGYQPPRSLSLLPEVVEMRHLTLFHLHQLPGSLCKTWRSGLRPLCKSRAKRFPCPLQRACKALLPIGCSLRSLGLELFSRSPSPARGSQFESRPRDPRTLKVLRTSNGGRSFHVGGNEQFRATTCQSNLFQSGFDSEEGPFKSCLPISASRSNNEIFA
jgi:hypothetical protein